MCVIAFAKKGVEIPDKATREKMWNHNKDGAGIMLMLPNGYNYYTKGMMTYDAFEKELTELSKVFNLTNLNVALHFRITTHGKSDGPTTHPFMLSKDYQELRKLDYIGKAPVVMHNGTIPGFGGILDEDSSDTQDYVGLILSRLLNQTDEKDELSQDALEKIIEATIGYSRMLIFNHGNIIRIGDWKEEDGIYYSNMNWKPTVYTYNYYNHYNELPLKSTSTETTNSKKETSSEKTVSENTDSEDIESLSDNYITFKDYDELSGVLNQMKINKEGNSYTDKDGQIWFPDYADMSIITNKGLKMLYPEHWRKARKELENEFTITTDWNRPTRKDLENYKAKCKGEKQWEISNDIL